MLRLGARSVALVVSSACCTGSVLVLSVGADSILPISVLALWVFLGGLAFHKVQARFTAVHMLRGGLAICAVGLIVAASVGLWSAGFLLGLGLGVGVGVSGRPERWRHVRLACVLAEHQVRSVVPAVSGQWASPVVTGGEGCHRFARVT